MTTRATALWIHGAGAAALDAPFDTVRGLLGADVSILAPQMGEPDPGIWGSAVGDALSQLSDDAVLIGHSLGGSVLLKVITERFPGFTARAFFALAAPYWGPGGWEYDGFRLPDNAADATRNINSMFFYHGTADDVVEAGHSELYTAAFPRASCRLVPGADHLFTGNHLAEFTDDLAQAGI